MHINELTNNDRYLLCQSTNKISATCCIWHTRMAYQLSEDILAAVYKDFFVIIIHCDVIQGILCCTQIEITQQRNKQIKKQLSNLQNHFRSSFIRDNNIFYDIGTLNMSET